MGDWVEELSRKDSPNWTTFLAWQEGQNQRPLQLKASKYSSLQSRQRTLANPFFRSPHVKYCRITPPITGRKGVGPSQEIHREVLKVKTRKKVVTSMGSVAASGGYYIACASDLIVANPGTITGSIGVLMEFTNSEELFKKIGIKGVVLKSGEHKDIGPPFREMTPEEKKILQAVIDNVHQQFIQAVADGRKMDRSKVAQIADGRILTGEQAKQAGLVDQIGNLQDAIDTTAKLVGIEGKPNILYPKRKFSLWELLIRETVSAILETLNEQGFELSYRLLSPTG